MFRGKRLGLYVPRIVLHLPETNSFGICLFPDVVTRYSVNSSIFITTQAHISLARLSRTCFFIGETALL